MNFESLKQPRITDQSDSLDDKSKQSAKEDAPLKKEEGSTESVSEKSQSAVETSDSERWGYWYLREHLKREQREIGDPVIKEAVKKRDQLLEARGLLQMPKADFDAYFASNEFGILADLKQQNIGDCYAVAAIHAMSRSPHFEMICRSSMKRLPDGSWEVKIPLLSENGQVITIAPDELLPQKNRRFLKWSKEDWIDLRRKLMLVEGKEGMQVLEAAFIKQKFGSVDRLAAEGGFGDEVLLSLGGDNFIQYSLSSARKNPRNNKWKYSGLSSLSKEDMAYLDHYLENFDPEIHIATVSTKRGVGRILGTYRARGTKKFFVPGHAYSVSRVDPENKIITLANPWDTSKPIELTFDQFKDTFSALFAIRIDSAKLLKNMRTVEKKAV